MSCSAGGANRSRGEGRARATRRMDGAGDSVALRLPSILMVVITRDMSGYIDGIALGMGITKFQSCGC